MYRPSYAVETNWVMKVSPPPPGKGKALNWESIYSMARMQSQGLYRYEPMLQMPRL